MTELIIKIVYMVLYVIAAAGRAPIAQKVKKMKAIISVKQKREYVLLFFGSIMMMLPLFYVFSDLLDSHNMGLPMLVRIIGGIAFAFAVYLHNWSHNALDVNWSPTLQIKKNQKLMERLSTKDWPNEVLNESGRSPMIRRLDPSSLKMDCSPWN